MSERNPVSADPMTAGAMTPTPWARAGAILEEVSATYWSATVRPDGAPHVRPVLAVWVDGGLSFCVGEHTRKARNLVLDPRCVITVEQEPLDLVLEGRAVKVRDAPTLRRVADAYARVYGWRVTVRDGAFHDTEGAPTAGPPPHDVYEAAPTAAFGFGLSTRRSSRRAGASATQPRDRGGVSPMRSGLFLPLFDELADPAMVARLSAEAEEAGWHGVFVWDQLRWGEPVAGVADPQITLAAIATATERIRFGPMVTPLARRRPVKVARETATLDRLSGGRLTLGVGLGSDRFASEFSITGEELDDRRRARMLDESLEILAAAWSGEPVHHRGEHYTVAGMRFLPRPVQTPGVPVGSPGTTAIPGRCAGPPATRAHSRSASTTPTSSPRRSPRSPRCARRRAGTPPSRTTWSSPCRPAATPPPMPPPGPPGGWSSSHRSPSRSTRCAV